MIRKMITERKRLFRANRCCCYCDKQMTFEEATIEHDPPTFIRKKIGMSRFEKLKLACGACNSAKSEITTRVSYLFSRNDEKCSARYLANLVRPHKKPIVRQGSKIRKSFAISRD